MILIGMLFHYFILLIGVWKVINVGQFWFAISIASNKTSVTLDSGQVKAINI